MLKKLLLALLLSLSLCFAGTCSAQDYVIQENELTRLEVIFSQLETNNNKLLNDLAESKTDLMQVRSKLESYQKDLATLQAELLKLKEESRKAKEDLEKAQTLLQKANESLDKYEKEVKAEIRGLKLQRNLCIVAAVWFAASK